MAACASCRKATRVTSCCIARADPGKFFDLKIPEMIRQSNGIPVDETRHRAVHAPPHDALVAAQPEQCGALELRSALPTGRAAHWAQLAARVCRAQPCRPATGDP